MRTGFDSVSGEGTDVSLAQVADRSVGQCRAGGGAEIADEDVVVVATAAAYSCRVDTAGRAVGEVEKQANHEVDHRLKVFFDVPYVSCPAEGVESPATGEMLVLGMDVD